MLLMLNAKRESRSWQEALKFISQCPVCGEAYAVEQARLYAQQENANLVHISCLKCQSNFIAMVLVMGHGLSTIGMVSDLVFEDAKRLHQFSPFSLDEIIEAHKYLETENILLKIK